MEWGTITRDLYLSTGTTFVTQWADLDWTTWWDRYKAISKVYQFEIQLAQTIFSVLFGFGGFAFGIWRAWRYREKELFSRLKAFLGDQEDTVSEGMDLTFTRMIRPSITTPGFSSFDTLWSLSKFRTRWKFTPILAFAATETAAQQHLESTATSMDRMQASFGRYHAMAVQRAVASRLLCGAVEASTSAAADQPSTKQFHAQLALEHVRGAKKLPGSAADPHALELEILLLLQEEKYAEVSALAQKIITPVTRPVGQDLRSPIARDTAAGRGHKYQALEKIVNDNPVLALAPLNRALGEFLKHPHLMDGDLLDAAQIYELAAAAHKRRGQAWRLQDRRAKRAEALYRRVSNNNDPWSGGFLLWLHRRIVGDKYRDYLFDAAGAGLKRIERLQNDAMYFPLPFPQRPVPQAGKNTNPATTPPQ